MNYVFISPHFPKSYYQFVKQLNKVGFNVLAIADTNFENLHPELQSSLTDYYKVSDIANYDEVYKAVAYFCYKYGHIDFLESNNEHWLVQDARLRSDFNITTGKNASNILMFKSKEEEKIYYKKAKVKTARYHIPSTYIEGLKFIEAVGYPVVVKPDNGVGAYRTYKISCEEELKKFYFEEFPSIKYIMEEYVDGDLISFDGITDSNCNPVFYSNEVFPQTIMDVVNGQTEVTYYSQPECPSDLLDAGARTLKAFDAKYRYFHLEFFRLRTSKKGLGKKGDIIGLEVNMRSPGGYTPDIINFSKSVDSYKIFAEVMMFDKTYEDLNRQKYYTLYVGRRDGVNYKYNYNDLLNSGYDIKIHDWMPEVLSGAMGNEFYIVNVNTYDEMMEFSNKALEKF